MIEILYRDSDIVVCVKPAGVLSQADTSGGENLPDILKSELNLDYIEPVHRLDRPVFGVMVYAASRSAAASLSRQVKSGEFRKEYMAVVSGKPEEESGVYKDYLYKDTKKGKSYAVKTPRKGTKEASLSYEVAGYNAGRDISLVKIELHTGRTHQIRVQFSSRGMPILGDGKYGSRIKGDIALFSRKISFIHPKSGESMEFFLSLPQKSPWNDIEK